MKSFGQIHTQLIRIKTEVCVPPGFTPSFPPTDHPPEPRAGRGKSTGEKEWAPCWPPPLVKFILPPHRLSSCGLGDGGLRMGSEASRCQGRKVAAHPCL